jgi:subtilisin family serine protease
MASVWNKIDSGLALIYANYHSVQQAGAERVKPYPVVSEGALIRVELRYQGDLSVVERLGLTTEFNDSSGRATGVLHLRDLAAIASCDEVLTIRYGSEPKPMLDTSVPQIRANRLWTLGPAPHFQFTGHTGEGVLVGIIDTGVDIHHPFLWKRTIPDKATRVVRIWDMGLVPEGAEESPRKELLEAATPGRYGVEYTDEHINRILNAKKDTLPVPMPVRHRDCSGHGTHVTSIAAGDGRFKYRRIGVAPRADIIIVKHSFGQAPKVGGVDVNPSQQLKDAFTYIRKTADEMQRAVVINCSFASELGAHDGLNADDDWLRQQFDGSAGKICVFGVGNEAGNRQHATITFAAAGTIEVPVELFDTRTVLTEFSDCSSSKDNTKDLTVDFYYPSGSSSLEGGVLPPGEPSYLDGRALGAGFVVAFFGDPARFIFMNNREEAGVEKGHAIKRNQFRVTVLAKENTLHLTGIYKIKLKASGPLTVHAWTSQPSRKKQASQGLKFASANVPAEVHVEDHFQINSFAAVDNIIAVAAYDDAAALPVTDFSSRGPVVRHGVGASPPPKPDIAAPGLDIHAAQSRDSRPQVPGPTISKKGTSMAAPHVTGAIALLLQQDSTLTPSDVLKALQDNALKNPAPVTDEVGAGRLDVESAFNDLT